MIFKNRAEAGKLLAEQLYEFKDKQALILGVPRGGVVVADVVARQLGAELDVIITKKIGAPGNPEYALGAIDSKGHLVLNDTAVKDLATLDEYIEKEKEKVIKTIIEYEEKFREGRPPYRIENRIVIIVDDGAATGSTILPAIDRVKEEGAQQVVVALPVCPPDTAERLKSEVDTFVVLATPVYFMSVGQFYENFEQTSNNEVKEILDSYLEPRV